MDLHLAANLSIIKKVLLGCFILFFPSLGFTQHITSQEMFSEDNIDFLTMMISSEKFVYGDVEKNGDGWQIYADNADSSHHFTQNTIIRSFRKSGAKRMVVTLLRYFKKQARKDNELHFRFVLKRFKNEWRSYLYDKDALPLKGKT